MQQILASTSKVMMTSAAPAFAVPAARQADAQQGGAAALSESQASQRNAPEPARQRRDRATARRLRNRERGER